jgi:Fur family transcriptional regulator, stress-responsive regulator
MRSATEVVDRLRANGRKVTVQRLGVLRALEANATHPSAEALFDAVRVEMPSISLKTVYQTLYELEELGEVAILDLGTGSIRVDPNVEEPHHHLVCSGCGRVRDLDVVFPDLRVPVGGEQGFEVRTAEVVFRGRCAECRSDSVAPRVRSGVRYESLEEEREGKTHG